MERRAGRRRVTYFAKQAAIMQPKLSMKTCSLRRVVGSFSTQLLAFSLKLFAKRVSLVLDERQYEDFEFGQQHPLRYQNVKREDKRKHAI
jgi:hypothetical protein